MIPEHPLGLRTWLILGRRLEQIRRARADLASRPDDLVDAQPGAVVQRSDPPVEFDQWEPVSELLFDSDDQATLRRRA